MPELTAELAPQVLSACTENAEELAGALGRALDGEFVVKPTDPAAFDASRFAGPGLLLRFAFGDRSLIAAIAQSGDLIPEWVKEPDTTGQSKLDTLAQELGMLVVPEDLMADGDSVRWVDDLSASLAEAGPADGAQTLAMEIARGETLGELALVWPAGAAAAGAPSAADTAPAASEPAAEAAPAASEAAAETPPAVEEVPALPTARVIRPSSSPHDFRDLPPNVVSMLLVSVPLSVNLATKKATVDEIIELGPGSIITFDKSCEGLLEISLADRPIARGEAVKVGEKFGVRVSEMILPQEHFRTMMTVAAS